MKTLFILFIFSFTSQILAESSSLESSSPAEFEIPKTIRQASKSVWKVSIGGYAGTAFFISPKHFVTNYHVVRSLTNENIESAYLIQLNNTFQKRRVLKTFKKRKVLKIHKLLAISPINEIAILEIEGEVEDYLTINFNSENFSEHKARNFVNMADVEDSTEERLEVDLMGKHNHNIFAVGYPDLQFGILKSLFYIKYREYGLFFYTTLNRPVDGASGSPILNKKGEVIGIIHANGTSEKSVFPRLNLSDIDPDMEMDSVLILGTSLEYFNFSEPCAEKDTDTCLREAMKYSRNLCFKYPYFLSPKCANYLNWYYADKESPTLSESFAFFFTTFAYGLNEGRKELEILFSTF